MRKYKKEEKPYVCLYCGKQGYGRADRKFCSSACKSAWHNEINKNSRLYRSRILTALNKNYIILREALERGELSTDIITMEDRGFRPCYVTGFWPARLGADIYRCFDISYCRSASRIYKIRREDREP